jgi:hypothetical protein
MRIGIVLAVTACLIAPLRAADLPDQGLKGIWKIGLPASAGYRDADFFGAVGETNAGSAVTQQHALRFGATRQQLCRIGGEEAALQLHCISFGDGTVTARGSEVIMTWSGDGRTRMTLLGTLETAGHFTGTFTLEDNRERHSAPDKMASERVSFAGVTDDSGLGVMLKGALVSLSLGDNSLLQAGAPDVAPPQDLAALGRLQAVYPVGPAPLLRDPQARPFFEVYAVEFARGERLCGIHVGGYGKVDGLRCV